MILKHILKIELRLLDRVLILKKDSGGYGYIPTLFLYCCRQYAVSPSSPQTAPSCLKLAGQKNFIKKFLDL